jgi:CRISPR-associated protein Cas2
MTVLILHKVRSGFRGRLTRWMIQPDPGVYVGHPSARIRERIWKLVTDEIDFKGGSAVLLHSDNSEQGYHLLVYGDPKRVVRDFDGLCLPKTPKITS